MKKVMAEYEPLAKEKQKLELEAKKKKEEENRKNQREKEKRLKSVQKKAEVEYRKKILEAAKKGEGSVVLDVLEYNRWDSARNEFEDAKKQAAEKLAEVEGMIIEKHIVDINLGHVSIEIYWDKELYRRYKEEEKERNIRSWCESMANSTSSLD